MIKSFFLSAAALHAAAQSRPEAPPAQPSTWTYQTRAGQRVLRGATAQDPGDRIVLTCNNEHRLIAILFRLGGDPRAIADRAASGHWLIDGVAQQDVDPRPIIPVNLQIVSLARVDPGLFGRLIAARAAGFAWNGEDGTPLAAYQIDVASGREQIVEFARACDAEAYR
jgi:hypothetical protein